MKSLWKRPYPYPESLQQGLIQALGVGLAVALILGVLGPFEISSAPIGKRWQVAIGFGAVTACTLVLLTFVYQALKAKWAQSWTVGFAWVSLLFTFTLIGLNNLMYAVGMEMVTPSWKAFGVFQFFTWSVGVFPASILLVFQHNRLIYKNLQQANALNAQLAKAAQPGLKPDVLEVVSLSNTSTIVFVDEKQREVLKLDSELILALSAADNYTEVWAMMADGPQRTLIRGVLRQVAAPLESHPAFLRVHRSHWVNVARVKSADGNAQGMQIEIDGLPWKVPVARSQVPQLRATLAAQRNR